MKNRDKNQSAGGRIFSGAWRALAAAAILVAGLIDPALAQSNVAATRHNLSKSGPGTVKAPDTTTGETQICVFCHTPHGANTSAQVPLWNKTGSGQTYTRYTSSSLDANNIIDGFNEQPAGSSMMCLSCHDGTVALGNVNVLRGQKNVTITLNNTGTGGTMPGGTYGETSGYTRRLGTDLSNDHPISITYNDNLASTDKEMVHLTTVAPKQRDVPSNGTVIGVRSSGYKPLLPLEPTGPGGTGQVQCATCHDPHITKQKFLRLNRLQVGTPTGGNFNQGNDIICLACHDKLGSTWAESAHAKPVVADETYQSAAATVRDFSTTTLPKVWEVACLNCHDTHTASGSRRLLREGVGGTTLGSGAGRYQQGTTTRPLDEVSAIENTCYQCHITSTDRVIGGATGAVPDIEFEFRRAVRMPLKTLDQGGTTKKEAHDITNADFEEPAIRLGLNTPANRHVECTDCHNPHRVRRGSTFYETSSNTGEGAKRTHNAGGTTLLKGADGNVASGVLRGAWGVEPVFGAIAATWPQNPTFPASAIKKGDPGVDNSIDRSKPYLTREYQLCFKCHSNYSNSESAASFPSLGNTLGGTPNNTNSLTRYTNVAAEFGSVKATDPPSNGTDQGEAGNSSTTCYGGDCAPIASGPVQTNNHRSWHPVMWPTGRSPAERGSASFSNIRAPFNTAANIGLQTMHCSDCHGDPGSWTTGGPDTGKVQGPHGSDKPFLLKGDWVAGSGSTRTTPSSPGVCGNCHNPTGGTSGFAGSSEASHNYEDKNDAGCTFCHIAVPHGWKNKAFLVNLSCVGPENGETSGFDINGCKSKAVNYTAAPYYVGAKLTISSWAVSRGWGSGNCSGVTWMQESCGSW